MSEEVKMEDDRTYTKARPKQRLQHSNNLESWKEVRTIAANREK